MSKGGPSMNGAGRLKTFPLLPGRNPWDGSPLDGKTILLHAEQGLGDTLQFIRYAAVVKQRGGPSSPSVTPTSSAC